jgi:hypothetical protein
MSNRYDTASEPSRLLLVGVGIVIAHDPPGGRGGHPSPAPTERSVQFYRTTLFSSWFTA